MNKIHKLTVSYNTIKQIMTLAPTYYVLQGNGGYEIFVVGENLFTSCCILDSTSITNFETNYKSKCIATVSGDDALILGSVANKIPFVQSRLADGRTRVSSEKTSASTVTFYSHNWCDRTSWYEKSIRVIETATNTGDNLSYKLSHINIIDSYHAKYTNEDFIKNTDGYSYRVSVLVDGYSKTEQDPHYGSGGHFTVNYVDGYINFFTAQNPASTVSVTYHYATNSIFTIKPAAGKALRLGVAEVQFSDDVEINDSVLFQPYGFVEVFAPQYCTTNGGPYPPGTKIPLGNPLIYKCIQDYLNDSKKSYPTYPALGGNGWRGMPRPCIIMDWEYEGDKVLRYDYGMEIRVYLQHDTVFGGEYSTVTFYCRSEDL